MNEWCNPADPVGTIIVWVIVLAVIGFMIASAYLLTRPPQPTYYPQGLTYRVNLEELKAKTQKYLAKIEKEREERSHEWWVVKTVDGKKTEALGEPEVSERFLTFRKKASLGYDYEENDEISIPVTFNLDQVVMWYMERDPDYEDEDEDKS